MILCSTIEEFNRAKGKNGMASSGFVPTMGALHAGHISLVERSVRENPLSIVSIFVNPAQFTDPEDLKKYPRMPSADLEMLSAVMRKDDIVFMPGESEIYPGREPEVIFDFKNLDKVMEGAFRPGHFKGVVRVVSRLFDIVMPGVAYFGQKDFQQVTIIRELVRQQKRATVIIPCPVIREPDGLAMSSRNLLLDPLLRPCAGTIFKTLTAANGMLPGHEIPELKKFVADSINKIKGFRLEYFEIADDAELNTINARSEMKPGRKYYGCIAVWAGSVRLIDNVEFDCSVTKG